MPKMLTVCPTRGRFKMFKDMIESFIDKTSEDTNIICSIDEDDADFQQYLDFINEKGIACFFSYPITVTEHINNVYNSSPGYDYYHITNDDVIYHTQDWDRIAMGKLEAAGGGIAYGDDGFQGEGLCTFPIISASVTGALGWLQEPSLNRFSGDSVWMELGRMAKCLYYCQEIIIEHRHFLNGKRENDLENFERIHHLDRMAFANWLSNKSIIDTRKVRGALNGGK